MALAVVCAAPATAAGTDGDSAASSSDVSSLVPDQGLATRDVRIAAQREPAQPISAAAAAAQAKIRHSLGRQGLVQVDPLTGTPRIVADLDGFLTGPSDAAPKAIARGYLRRHATAFGLDASDMSSLRLARHYRDVHGTTHFVWAQAFDGIEALDNGVYANVAKDGRLINVMGSPVSDLGVRTTQPDVSARGALSTALGNAGVPARKVPAKTGTRGADSLTSFEGGTDSARLVLFTEEPGVTSLAWRVTAEASSTEVYDYVIDASTGGVLYRTNTVDFATGRVWEYAPNLNSVCAGCGAAAGAQTDHNFPVAWGTAANQLNGNFAHVYTDVNDDNAVDGTFSGNCPDCGEIPTNGGGNWTYNFAPNPGDPTFESGFDCDPAFPQCSWYVHSPTGWQGWGTNIRQNSTQVYWYVNNFHDWLKNTASIGFTPASGNFEGVDAVQAQTFDGAATDTSPGSIPGTPDNDHVNNANMSTQADGIPPRMQMYLFYDPASRDVQTNGGDDATVIYHEYTHGLSNRLVTDTSNNPALKSFQARSMGEGWSDWYALDYLEGNNLDEDDTAADGQMNMAVYTLGGEINTSLRSQGLDCQVPTNNATTCPGGNTTGPGGYTLGDMGHVISGPEFHADGEIWAETLWDLRHNAPGAGFTVNQIRTIVTDGMRLSVPDPSMLDMRNAIIQAAMNSGGAGLRNFAWQTFAHRGMGYFASDQGSSDTSPTEDFNTPPNCATPGSCGTLSGKVVDADTLQPVANTTVAIRGAGDLVATTNASGNYAINDIPPHTYDQLTATHVGFNPTQANAVTVGTGTTTLNLSIRRDWAAINGGGQVLSVSPPDYTAFGCGPEGAFDLSLGSGWGSTSLNPVDPSNGPGGAKSVVVQLPKPIDLKSLAVDPGATCGDDDNASTQTVRIQTSPNNVANSYITVAQPNFGTGANHHLNTVTPTSFPKKVRFIKATMLANQDPNAGSGRNFMDLSELQVYGKPSDITKPVISGALIQAGQTVRSIIANGFKISSHLSEAATEKGTLTITAQKAQQLGIPRQIGAGTLPFAAAATKAMTMQLTQAAKSKLKTTQGSLAVTATLNATDKALNKATPVSKSATLPH